MKLLKLKLPRINNSRNIQSENKEINNIKLIKHIQQNPYNNVKIRKNTRTINYCNILRPKESESKLDNSNDINSSIRSFLFKNLSIQNNLSPKSNISKINSIKNNFNITKLNINKLNAFKRRPSNINPEKDMNLFLLKVDKIFGGKSELKHINNISKALIKNKENGKNKNTLLEEDKKQSMSCLLDNDISNNNIKNTLTNNLKKKIIFKDPIFNLKKINDHYKLRNSNFTPSAISNIRKIKYFENMIQEKIRFKHRYDDVNNCKSERKRNQYKLYVNKRLKNIRNEINDSKIGLKKINNSIHNILQKARNLIDYHAKSIYESKEPL